MAVKKTTNVSDSKKKTQKTTKKVTPKVIDIAKFFNVTREKEGVWYEPKIDGIRLGLEFKVLGPSSEVVRQAAVEYDKIHEKNEKLFETNPQKALDSEQTALAKRAAAAVIDFRGANGNAITINGEPLAFSKEIVERIFFENGDITGDVLATSVNGALFK